MLVCTASLSRCPAVTSRVRLRLALPGELAKHAVSEGTKAVSKFDPDRVMKSDHDGSAIPTVPPSELSRFAGLQFPVVTIGYDASRFSGRSVSIGGAVYLSAVCEYVHVDGWLLMVLPSNPFVVVDQQVSCGRAAGAVGQCRTRSSQHNHHDVQHCGGNRP